MSTEPRAIRITPEGARIVDPWDIVNSPEARAHLEELNRMSTVPPTESVESLLDACRDNPYNDAAAAALLAAVEREKREARDNEWYRFGCAVWLWLADNWSSEDGWEIAELAVTAGLAERVTYDPEKHGECEADPGDEIIWPIKGDPLPIRALATPTETTP